MIREICKLTGNEVISGEGMSEDFETTNGVRQGCPLSPVLFDLFLDDIDKEWENKGLGGTVMGKEKLYTLTYADDIAILAKTAEYSLVDQYNSKATRK